MGLDSIELFLALEEEFEIDIPNQIVPGFRTVGDVTDFILRAVRQRAEEQRQALPDEQELRDRVAAVIAQALGVNVEVVTPEAELVRDLAVDG